jgi:hypothetical protein
MKISHFHFTQCPSSFNVLSSPFSSLSYLFFCVPFSQLCGYFLSKISKLSCIGNCFTSSKIYWFSIYALFHNICPFYAWSGPFPHPPTYLFFRALFTQLSTLLLSLSSMRFWEKGKQIGSVRCFWVLTINNLFHFFAQVCSGFSFAFFS